MTALHPSLATPQAAAVRLVHDALVHLVQAPHDALGLRMAIPATWDADAFEVLVQHALAARGMHGVEVTLVPTSGQPRLLSVAKPWTP